MPALPRNTTDHRPLAHHARLDHLPVACMAVRAGSAACQRCADVCPADALRVDSDGPHLTGDCLGCGRCAVACPTGALTCRGFDAELAADGLAPVRVECQRVPPAGSGAGTRVPCLGGMATAQVLELVGQAGPRPVHLIDRGACAGCLAGTGRSSADELLDRTRPWLKVCGVPESLWPVRMLAPAPSRCLPLGVAAQEATLSRRGFFRRVTTDVGQPRFAASVPAGPRAQLRSSPAPVPARERWLAVLSDLAARHGRPLPTAALFHLEVDGRCQGHGLCASNCPTGALQTLEAEGVVELRLDATRCVGCDRCVAACPEHAITLTSGGRPDPVVVHRVEQRACASCGDTFGAAEGSRALCPRCRQGQDLARSLFGPTVGMGVAET